MRSNSLRATLDELRAERRETEERAMTLQSELNVVARRLTNLLGAISNLEELIGVPSEDDEAVLADDTTPDEDTRGATPRTVDFSTVDEHEPPVRKRVPSTDWVAEVVNAIGTAANRDTIYAKFEEMKGIPESWVANPRNSFNNALGRAVERRMIMKYGDDEFAPLNWNPFREADRASAEVYR